MQRLAFRFTILGMGLLVATLACGFWLVRITGVLYWQTLTTPIYQLVILDYFAWGVSLPGALLVAFSYCRQARPLLPAERSLLGLGILNAIILLACQGGLWTLYSSLMYLRYYVGYLVCSVVTIAVVYKCWLLGKWTWTNTLGMCALVIQTIGLWGFRLAPIDVVLETP